MTQPADAAPSPPPTSSPRREEADGTNVKETIESILVAFILAFVFRAFVVEAFVIPTGSMAPTLLGAHQRFDCPDCGHHFTVNYSGQQIGDDVIIPSFNRIEVQPGQYRNRVLPIVCPNCGYKLPQVDPADPDNDATSPPVFYGDRILVLKHEYLFRDPARWDVIVFKDPTSPERFDYSRNFIKRLVGKPGETVMILDGDIYISTKPAGMPVSPGDFVVRTKPPEVQRALWRLVSDNDYQPTGRTRSAEPFVSPWKPTSGEGWNLQAGPGTGASARRVFRFDSQLGTGGIAFDPKSAAGPYPLTDWLAYDMAVNLEGRLDAYSSPLFPPKANVSDVKLDLRYRREAGGGPLRLSLGKLGDVFTAELYPDHVRLLQKSGDEAAVEIQSVAMNLGQRERHVEFQNVDYQVTLMIDGEPVIQTTGYQPNVEALLEAFASGAKLPPATVAIEAANQTAEVSHLSLWRDVYYLNITNTGEPQQWATPYRFPENLMRLGEDEYFVCGDNSLLSGDARAWTDSINLPDEGIVHESGRVPRRFLLGKAFFVYWPAGYRPTSGSPGVIPNFGDMRFIR